MSTVRLPTPGGDDGTWGSILNQFLDVSLNSDGTLLPGAIQQAGGIVSSAGSGSGMTVSGIPTTGQALVATSDSTASWQTLSGSGAPASLSGDSDVSLSSPAANQVLAYTGSVWQNATLTESDVANLSSDLSTLTSNVSSVTTTANNLTTSVSTLTSSVAAKYTKPGGGIPSSDMASAVQTALSAAGTAVQLAGDLGGTAASPTIARIQGTSISTPSGGATAYLNASGTWTVPAGGGGGGVTLDTTATDIQPNTTTGSGVAGNTGKAADAGHQHALSTHGHTSSSTGGQLGLGALATTGTASSSTYLRGDGTWSTPSGGGAVASVFGRTGTVVATTGDYTATQVGALPSTTTLNAIASANATSGNIALNSNKLTGLTPGSASTDAATFGQIPTAGTGLTNTSGVLSVTYGTTSTTAAVGNDARITGAVQHTGATFTGYVAPAVVTLTDAASIAVNAALGNDFRVTIAGNRTLANPSSPVDGQRIIFQITQDATGSRTLSYGNAYTFSTGLPQPTLSTTANMTDLLGFIYNAALSQWLLVAFVNGFN